MRRISRTTAKRYAEAAPVRRQLIQEVGRCEMCGHDPIRVQWGQIRWVLDVHEIRGGAHRQKALDKRFAVLVVCRLCHMENSTWPKARQLACLKRSRPEDYDLAAFNALTGYRIPETEVTEWEAKVYGKAKSENAKPHTS